MDYTRDNPLKRFTAFWIALLLVTAFGIALILFKPFAPDRVDKAYLMKGESRLEVKEEIDRAQQNALDPSSLEKALETQVKNFSANPETAGSMPVPGAAPAAK